MRSLHPLWYARHCHSIFSLAALYYARFFHGVFSAPAALRPVGSAIASARSTIRAPYAAKDAACAAV
eukprot:2168634-Rhodomonas_salina.2